MLLQGKCRDKAILFYDVNINDCSPYQFLSDSNILKGNVQSIHLVFLYCIWKNNLITTKLLMSYFLLPILRFLQCYKMKKMSLALICSLCYFQLKCSQKGVVACIKL